MKPKTISIRTVVDVVGALATEKLSGNIYLMDNNKIDELIHSIFKIL